MPVRNVPVAAAGARVQDVMLRAPRTLAPTATVADARQAFANARERLLLVAQDGVFLGAVARDGLEEAIDGAVPLSEVVDREADRVGPQDTVARALAALDARQAERLPVVDAGGALVGLVCFNRRHGHFCVDG